MPSVTMSVTVGCLQGIKNSGSRYRQIFLHIKPGTSQYAVGMGAAGQRYQFVKTGQHHLFWQPGSQIRKRVQDCANKHVPGYAAYRIEMQVHR